MRAPESIFPVEGYYWVMIDSDPVEIVYFDGKDYLYSCGTDVATRFTGKHWESLGGPVSVIMLAGPVVLAIQGDG